MTALNTPGSAFRMQHPRSSFFGEVSAWFFWLTILFIVLPVGLWILPPLISLSALLIVASMYAMHHLVAVFHLKRLTIPSFFYFIYLAVILTPGFFIFRDEYSQSRWHFLFGIESVLITVPLGIWIANSLFQFRRRETEEYFCRTLREESLGGSAVRLYSIFLVLAAALVLLNFMETPAVPLFFLIRNPGDFLTVALLREDSFKLLASHFTYLYYVLRGTIFPFLIIVAFGRYRKERQKVWRRLFWISLILGLFYAGLTVEKSPVATIFGLLVVFLYLFRGGTLGRTATIAAPLLFLSFPLMVVLLAYHGTEGGSLSAAFQAIGERLFYGPAQVVEAYFQVFPALVSYQHGASMTKLATLMGWTTIDIPNTVGLYMMGTQGDLSSISANSCFVGALNADFGLVGVVLGGALAGVIMQAVHIYLFRKPKNVVNLAAYAICAWSFGMLVANPLPTVLLSGGVTFALILRFIFANRSRHSSAASLNPTILLEERS